LAFRAGLKPEKCPSSSLRKLFLAYFELGVFVAEKKWDFESLSERYAEFGIPMTAKEIEWVLARLEASEASMEAVRSIDSSDHEPAVELKLRREGEASANG
jgi:hypothetical protein